MAEHGEVMQGVAGYVVLVRPMVERERRWLGLKVEFQEELRWFVLVEGQAIVGSGEAGGFRQQWLGIRRVIGQFLVGALCVQSLVEGEQENRGCKSRVLVLCCLLMSSLFISLSVVFFLFFDERRVVEQEERKHVLRSRQVLFAEDVGQHMMGSKSYFICKHLKCMAKSAQHGSCMAESKEIERENLK